MELTPYLQIGENVLAAEVIHYPGNRHLANEFKAGPTAQVSSMQGGLLIYGDPDWQTDETYRCLPLEAYAFTPVDDTDLMYMGHFEAVNGALYPTGWKDPGFLDADWQPAVPVAVNAPYIMGGLANVWQVEPDPIPLPYEEAVALRRITRCAPEIADRRKPFSAADGWSCPPGKTPGWNWTRGNTAPLSRNGKSRAAGRRKFTFCMRRATALTGTENT